MSWRNIFPEKPTVAQLLIQFPVFYRTCGFITIFTTAWLTPSHLIPLAHLSSVLTYILHRITSLLRPKCLGHFKRHADITKWGGGVRHWQIALTYHIDLKLVQKTRNKTQISNLTKHNLNYIYYIWIKKNYSEKHNPVLNWHNQNPNKTTAEMSIAVLQWL